MITGSYLDSVRDDSALLASMIPMGRFGTAEEIAAGVVFLASDAASYISGANIRIAGGRP